MLTKKPFIEDGFVHNHNLMIKSIKSQLILDLKMSRIKVYKIEAR